MRIPPYWRKEQYCGRDRNGRERCYEAWGWSFDSPEDARADAAARAERRFNRPDTSLSPERYDYLDRPLREEIVESIAHEDRDSALITRNRYGCLVLNTAFVCFVDVDYPPPRGAGILDGLLLAFSARRRRERAQALRESTKREVMDWAAENPQRGFRLYETAAGLRLLFTDQLYAPGSDEVAALFEALHSDMLYRRLTVKQECFRARLTPKPWRCACPKPPNQYPWESDADEHRYRQWERDYYERTKNRPVCRVLDIFGPDAEEKEISAIVNIHDHYTCLDSDQPLA